MATRANRAATGNSKRTVSHRHRDVMPAPAGGGKRHHNQRNEERETFMLHREETTKRRHNVESGTTGNHSDSLIRRIQKTKAA